MKPIQVASTNDENAQLPFVIPVKGRKPLEITLPRFDFLSEDEFEAIESGLKALDEDESLSGRKKTIRIALVMLEQFVTKTQLAVLEKLPPGVLDDLLAKWRGYSMVTLGESPAFVNSSTENTEAPSNTTSSPTPVDTVEPISAAV